MAKLSRVEKHKNQKDYLNDDLGTNINNDELRQFQSRLNKIDANNFEAPDENTSKASDYDPLHARHTESIPVEEPKEEEEEDDSIPDDSDFNLHFNEAVNPQDDNELTNDYLSRYINEVKQYNIDQGNAASGDTQYNILRNLNQGREETPSTPYPSRRTHEEPESTPARKKQARTTEVPFINSSVTPSSRRSAESEDEMSVDDIASRVQHMADDGSAADQEPKKERTSHINTDEFTRQLEIERTTNQRLLDQTTQMQARMDDVGENLNDVSNKMRHTNQILNIVLVVVIVALLIVFGILIYWIVMAGGTQ
jgi:hypothetical protein